VAINTNILDLREFLSHIITNTNMTCLSSLGDGEGAVASLEGSNFLAANLYVMRCSLMSFDLVNAMLVRIS
jgi:hypothetical protein